MYIDLYTVTVFLIGYVFAIHNHSESLYDFIINLINTTKKVINNFHYMTGIIDGDIKVI